MRKTGKSILALVLTLCVLLSLGMPAAFADTDTPVTAGAGDNVTVEGNVSVEDAETAVSAEQGEATVTGDVENLNGTSYNNGVVAVNGTVVVEGSVTVESARTANGLGAEAGEATVGDITVEGQYAQGVFYAAQSELNTGDITATGSQSAVGVSSVYQGSVANTGDIDVTVSGNGLAAGVAYGRVGEVNAGDITVEADSGYALGVYRATNNITCGDISVTGARAYGVYNEDDFQMMNLTADSLTVDGTDMATGVYQYCDSLSGINLNIGEGGLTVTSENGESTGINIMVEDHMYAGNINIGGDVTADNAFVIDAGYGVTDFNIVVDGTVNSAVPLTYFGPEILALVDPDNAAAMMQNSEASAEYYNNLTDEQIQEYQQYLGVDPTVLPAEKEFSFTVYAINTGADDAPFVTVDQDRVENWCQGYGITYTESAELTAACNDIAQQMDDAINYIIRYSKEQEGASTSLSDVRVINDEYETARANEEFFVNVKPADGYRVVGVYWGDQALQSLGSNRFSCTMLRGGGLTLRVVMEKIPVEKTVAKTRGRGMTWADQIRASGKDAHLTFDGTKMETTIYSICGDYAHAIRERQDVTSTIEFMHEGELVSMTIEPETDVFGILEKNGLTDRDQIAFEDLADMLGIEYTSVKA